MTGLVVYYLIVLFFASQIGILHFEILHCGTLEIFEWEIVFEGQQININLININSIIININ